MATAARFFMGSFTTAVGSSPDGTDSASRYWVRFSGTLVGTDGIVIPWTDDIGSSTDTYESFIRAEANETPASLRTKAVTALRAGYPGYSSSIPVTFIFDSTGAIGL